MHESILKIKNCLGEDVLYLNTHALPTIVTFIQQTNSPKWTHTKTRSDTQQEHQKNSPFRILLLVFIELSLHCVKHRS